MTSKPALALLAAACMGCAGAAFAADPPSDDRLNFSVNGSTLTYDHGGGGGSIGWLHNFSENTLLDAEAEYETVYNSHWTFGSLNGSSTFGEPGKRLSVYGEVHEGAGAVGTRSFDYSIVAAGLIRTFGTQFSAQVEDRQIDVDRTHGNLPKIGASYLWSPLVQTSFSYAHSFGGNVGSRLGTARVDLFSPNINWLGGVAFGQASPEVLNLQGIVVPGKTLKEIYAGASKPLPRGKLTLVVDYLDLSGFKRTTVTLSYLVGVGASGRSR